MIRLNVKIIVLFLSFFLIGSSINSIDPKMFLENDLGEIQTLDPDTFDSRLKKIKSRITTNHDPININGDTDFATTATNEGWPGTGTVNDPYIIESYSITTNGSTAISINNTQVYFQIRNCEINSTASMLNTGYQLVNVSHGTLMNNTATSFYFAVSLTNSSFNRVEGNTFATTLPIFGVGFYLWNSSKNELTNNVVDSFRWGYQLSHSDSNTLTHNLAINCSEDGFNLYRSHTNNFSTNTVKDGSLGFYIRYSHSNILHKNIIINNINNPISSLNSFYNRFSTNNISNNNLGMYWMNSSWNEFIHNVIFNHTSFWRLASNSSHNTISWNTVIDTDNYGIELY